MSDFKNLHSRMVKTATYENNILLEIKLNEMNIA